MQAVPYKILEISSSGRRAGSVSRQLSADMIARAQLTFRYTDNGPVGLLRGKKAYLLVATGGVPVGSSMDFATPYLRQALSFVGIDDVEIIAADGLNSNAGKSIDSARAQIAELLQAEELLA